jgi:hypothetical protein
LTVILFRVLTLSALLLLLLLAGLSARLALSALSALLSLLLTALLTVFLHIVCHEHSSSAVRGPPRFLRIFRFTVISCGSEQLGLGQK